MKAQPCSISGCTPIKTKLTNHRLGHGFDHPDVGFASSPTRSTSENDRTLLTSTSSSSSLSLSSSDKTQRTLFVDMTTTTQQYNNNNQNDEPYRRQYHDHGLTPGAGAGGINGNDGMSTEFAMLSIRDGNGIDDNNYMDAANDDDDDDDDDDTLASRLIG